MTTSGNKNAQLRMPKAKTVYTGLHTYSNEFVEAKNGLLKYGNNHYFRGVRKTIFHSKIFKFVAGQKMADGDKSS